MQSAIYPKHPGRPDSFQIDLVFQLFPNMLPAIGHVAVAVGMYRFFEHFHIHSIFGLVAEHGFHLTGRAVIISLPVAPIGALEHIFSNVYRPLLPLSAGHIDHHDRICPYLICLYISV